jgi:hypothetical protein
MFPEQTPTHQTARTESGTGTGERRRREGAGGPGTPGPRSGSWRTGRDPKGCHGGEGRRQKVLTTLGEHIPRTTRKVKKESGGGKSTTVQAQQRTNKESLFGSEGLNKCLISFKAPMCTYNDTSWHTWHQSLGLMFRDVEFWSVGISFLVCCTCSAWVSLIGQALQAQLLWRTCASTSHFVKEKRVS